MGFLDKLTGLAAGLVRSPDPPPPATIAGSEARERAAAGLDLDGLCKVMRPRALAFARAYLRGGTGRAAALAAGYSEPAAHKAAHRLLRDPFVRRYIALVRVERALADRADLHALVAQLWRIASGQDQAATVKERENARSNLTRILLATQPAAGEGHQPVAAAPAGSGGGFDREARLAFEREVLGVEVSGDVQDPGPGPDLRPQSRDPAPVQDPGPRPGSRTAAGEDL